MDETLIHSVFQPVKDMDFIAHVPAKDGVSVSQIYIYKRPGVDMFLRRVSQLFEIVIFTASINKYADAIMNKLDPTQLCSYRLYREHCTMYSHSKGNFFLKDLGKLGRDMKDVFILDNSPISYALHTENAVPIKTWIDD